MVWSDDISLTIVKEAAGKYCAAPRFDGCGRILPLFGAGDPAGAAIATDAIRTARENGGVDISRISLFELGWLARNQRLVLKTPLEAFLVEVETRFLILPITAAVTRIAVEFPPAYPLDAMDRIIGATALHRGVPLVTKDKMIRKAASDGTRTMRKRSSKRNRPV